MFGVLLLTFGFILITYAFHKLTANNARYFEERNLKYRGALDSLRIMLSVFLGKIGLIEMTQKSYDFFRNEPIFGLFDFSIRQYFIRDPDAYRRIAIKDFDHFEDHRVFVDEKMDDLFGNSLISMHGEKWRQMRATLSPAFTGSKMRQMFELVSECADEIVKHFTKQAAKGEEINIEMKDFFSRYTNDVIATCAFGIKVNSFDNPDNEFFQTAKKLLNFGGIWRTFKLFIIFIMPKVASKFNFKFFDDSITGLFKSIIFDTMAMRQNNNIYRPDLINMLMRVREGKQLDQQTEEKLKDNVEGFATVEESDVGKANVTQKWKDNELIAQCFLFFIAGFDTSSSALTFCAYELVANPDIQQKLYEEIDEVNEQLEGRRVTYDVLQKMIYMDQVVSETLRKWPIAVQTDRLCVRDYVYDDGERKFTIEKGSNILFSIYAVHHDPKYYKQPEKFDPARFSDENKHNIVPGTYTPFGIGPRNCIGSRFALMELKAILYYLLLNFTFEPNKDTQIPLKMSKVPFIKTEKGVHLQLKPRANKLLYNEYCLLHARVDVLANVVSASVSICSFNLAQSLCRMLGELLLSVGIALIAYAIYKFVTNSARYFEERNVKYKGISFALHNLYSMFTGQFDAFGQIQTLYNAYPDEPVYGVFDFSSRQYIFRDPEAYKRIAIKDFANFEDHRVFIDEKMDSLLGNSLFALHGEKWRQMRATLSPAFTGSKMRLMFELVSECADEIMKHFLKQAKSGEKINIEMKDFFSRYTNDVIATCAFGIKVNSIAEPNNDFFLNSKKMMNFTSFWNSIKFVIFLSMPQLAKIFKLRLINGTVTDEFKSMILDTMAMRQNNNIYRPDMINMLMQAREGSLQHQAEEKSKETDEGFATVEESEVGKASVTRKWNDDELVAQCFLFFLAGFESAATVLMFAAYELLTNPDVQQKLYEEIAELNERLGGKRISYDAIQKMKYLDQVVSETLRKWPISVQTDRVCGKPYVYDDGQLKFEIEKGSNILFPIYGIHHDPKYFPNPSKFDPERFSDEKKHNILPGTYVPFGLGPRNCIGSRFALMELKAILYYLLLKFSFEANEKTQIPLKMKKGLFVLPEKGVHLELKPRSEN
ncbi:uncharacterized protein LOC129580438 [Sitodiplosis mosellana]|uniref:uncharacterized protein LOC129580438 n=1 Tax=Sitodiplosis mosellana TaxID=263140 RepID=UPI0024445EAA|nr:uncharacterized protein LOC129580438 [Sitodiplosis mosellana]